MHDDWKSGVLALAVAGLLAWAGVENADAIREWLSAMLGIEMQAPRRQSGVPLHP